mgnify:FL=1
MRSKNGVLSIFVAAMAFFAVGNAAAADWPARSFRWIVPYPPAGTTDILARIIGQRLSEKLGQTIVIDNRPGAGNNLGTEIAIKAAPDGYTWFLVNPANAINASLYEKLNFNFLADVEPIAGFIRVPNVMVVTNKNFAPRTVAEFIAHGKAPGSKINWASSGSGTSVHLSGEMFKMMTGVNMLHVPYKGAGPALIDMIAGQMHVIFDNMPSSIGYIRSGDLRALGVTTAQRSPALPNVPTVAETVPGYEASAWFGVGAPKGTPAAIVNRVNREVNELLRDPKMLQRLADLGGTPIAGSPSDFWAIHKMETEKWAKVVKASGAKVQ